MFEIEGMVMEVGTIWDNDTRISIEVKSPTGEGTTVNFPCTKEEAKAAALKLYQRVTVSVKPIDGVLNHS